MKKLRSSVYYYAQESHNQRGLRTECVKCRYHICCFAFGVHFSDVFAHVCLCRLPNFGSFSMAKKLLVYVRKYVNLHTCVHVIFGIQRSISISFGCRYLSQNNNNSSAHISKAYIFKYVTYFAVLVCQKFACVLYTDVT